MSGAASCGMAYGAGIAVAGVFAALSIVHVYWGLGGTVGLKAAIPERPTNLEEHASEGRSIEAFHPSVAMTLLVACALAMVGALVILRAGILAPARADGWLRWSLAAVALILTARAVGDLTLVGFFKRIRDTRFAVLDTWLYSPLCVFLALGLASLTFDTCDPGVNGHLSHGSQCVHSPLADRVGVFRRYNEPVHPWTGPRAVAKLRG